MNCLTDQSERALSLLGEIVMRPAFPEDTLKTTVSQALTEITLMDSDPDCR